MKKLLLLAVLVCSTVLYAGCCSAPVEKTKEVSECCTPKKMGEMQTYTYATDRDEKVHHLNLNICSDDFFETATLKYIDKNGIKKIVKMKREVSASGVIMHSINKEDKVECLAKGDFATFIIDGVQYKTHLVK